MPNQYARFGTLIAERRKNLGMTGAELAGHLDVAPQMLCDWEKGRRIPLTDELMSALASELELHPDVLFAEAGTIGEAEEYFRRQPEAVKLVRAMAAAQTDECKIRSMRRFI